MLLPPPRPPEGAAVARLTLATLIILGLACVAYAVTGCASSAPPEVLRADEAKAQLARDIWWYEPDGGADAADGAP